MDHRLAKPTSASLYSHIVRSKVVKSMFPMGIRTTYLGCVFQTLDQRERKRVEETDQHTQTMPPRSLVRFMKLFTLGFFYFSFDVSVYVLSNFYVCVSRAMRVCVAS